MKIIALPFLILAHGVEAVAHWTAQKIEEMI